MSRTYHWHMKHMPKIQNHLHHDVSHLHFNVITHYHCLPVVLLQLFVASHIQEYCNVNKAAPLANKKWHNTPLQ